MFGNIARVHLKQQFLNYYSESQPIYYVSGTTECHMS